MKQKKHLIKFIYYTVLTLLLIIALLLILTVLPGFGGYKVLIVQSGSMEPAIKTGSLIIIKSADDYQVNDIITFNQFPDRNDASTTHRIISIDKDNDQLKYQTKGDANNSPDAAPINKNQIWGKTIAALPYLGYGVAAARTKLGFMIIILVPAGMIIFDEIKKIWRELQKKRQAKDQ